MGYFKTDSVVSEISLKYVFDTVDMKILQYIDAQKREFRIFMCAY